MSHNNYRTLYPGIDSSRFEAYERAIRNEEQPYGR